MITDDQAAALVRALLAIEPLSIQRQALTQSGNAIFRVIFPDQQSMVLRVSPQGRTFAHTAKNLLALSELGLPVQRVLASGPAPSGGSFILLNWLSGRDLMYELPTMTREQMTAVAFTICDYQKRVGTLPAGPGFGWAPIGKNAASKCWNEVFGVADSSLAPANAPAAEQLRGRLRRMRVSVEPYLSAVKPICFLDDLTIKNVLIETGRLTGIIDVDFVCYGDPLMSVGTTLALLAADIGDLGKFYGHELIRVWNPTAEQLHAIHFYAALWTVGLMNASPESERLPAIADEMLRLAEGSAAAPSILESATAHHRAGNLVDARRGYEQVIAADAANAVAQFRLGLLELQERRPQAALPLMERAVAAAPQESRYQFGLGEVLSTLGRWTDAAAAYQRVLELDPQNADAHFAFGLALHSAGDHDAAIAAYLAARQIQPDHAGAASNLGVIYQQRGQVEQAIPLLRLAVQLEPNVVSHGINLGAALCDLRHFAEAAQLLERVVQTDPASAEAHCNLANALRGPGQLREAVRRYEKAVELRPDYSDAWNNLGNTLKELGEFPGALAAYESALTAQPDFIPAINNSCCLLRTLGRLEEAETRLRAALSRNLDHPALYDTLGNVLKDTGQLDEAIDCFRKALAMEPGNAATHSNLAYAISFQSPAGEPILEECRRWNDRHAPERQAKISPRTIDGRIRIGYVSPDFREHCQSLFTVPLLSNHDHASFEIFCYSSVERPDAFTRRLAGYADFSRDVKHLDDAELCRQIRADGIDILVDLTMHMANGRPGVFAARAAPVQVAWLAYPGTTGIAAMDYRLSDPRLDPPEFESHYSERTLRLPDSFWCYDPLTAEPKVNDLPALAAGYLTLGCLNNPCKVTDHTLQLWAAVMNALPDSRLLLMNPPGAHRRHLLDRLAALGINPARIGFTPFQRRADYLRTYHRIDLGLDTFPYNGHTTSLDSFWMGVPVVTRIGQTCVGRGGLSQLHQLGLQELAAETDEQFVTAALKLARDLPRLTTLRQQLRSQMESSPLMNGPRFARNMESAYRTLCDMSAKPSPRPALPSI